MLRNFANLSLPISYTDEDGHEQTYTLGRDRLKYDDARRMCKEHHHGDLATISNAKEQDFVMNEVVIEANDYWIGLDDRVNEGNFQWVDSTPVEYTHWGNLEPDDGTNKRRGSLSYHNEDCAILRESGEWNDVNCNDKHMFICKKLILYPGAKDVIYTPVYTESVIKSNENIPTEKFMLDQDDGCDNKTRSGICQPHFETFSQPDHNQPDIESSEVIAGGNGGASAFHATVETEQLESGRAKNEMNRYVPISSLSKDVPILSKSGDTKASTAATESSSAAPDTTPNTNSFNITSSNILPFTVVTPAPGIQENHTITNKDVDAIKAITEAVQDIAHQQKVNEQNMKSVDSLVNHLKDQYTDSSNAHTDKSMDLTIDPGDARHNIWSRLKPIGSTPEHDGQPKPTTFIKSPDTVQALCDLSCKSNMPGCMESCRSAVLLMSPFEFIKALQSAKRERNPLTGNSIRYGTQNQTPANRPHNSVEDVDKDRLQASNPLESLREGLTKYYSDLLNKNGPAKGGLNSFLEDAVRFAQKTGPSQNENNEAPLPIKSWNLFKSNMEKAYVKMKDSQEQSDSSEQKNKNNNEGQNNFTTNNFSDDAQESSRHDSTSDDDFNQASGPARTRISNQANKPTSEHSHYLNQLKTTAIRIKDLLLKSNAALQNRKLDNKLYNFLQSKGSSPDSFGEEAVNRKKHHGRRHRKHRKERKRTENEVQESGHSQENDGELWEGGGRQEKEGNRWLKEKGDRSAGLRHSQSMTVQDGDLREGEQRQHNDGEHTQGQYNGPQGEGSKVNSNSEGGLENRGSQEESSRPFSYKDGQVNKGPHKENNNRESQEETSSRLEESNGEGELTFLKTNGEPQHKGFENKNEKVASIQELNRNPDSRDNKFNDFPQKELSNNIEIFRQHDSSKKFFEKKENRMEMDQRKQFSNNKEILYRDSPIRKFFESKDNQGELNQYFMNKNEDKNQYPVRQVGLDNHPQEYKTFAAKGENVQRTPETVNHEGEGQSYPGQHQIYKEDASINSYRNDERNFPLQSVQNGQANIGLEANNGVSLAQDSKDRHLPSMGDSNNQMLDSQRNNRDQERPFADQGYSFEDQKNRFGEDQRQVSEAGLTQSKNRFGDNQGYQGESPPRNISPTEIWRQAAVELNSGYPLEQNEVNLGSNSYRQTVNVEPHGEIPETSISNSNAPNSFSDTLARMENRDGHQDLQSQTFVQAPSDVLEFSKNQQRLAPNDGQYSADEVDRFRPIPKSTDQRLLNPLIAHAPSFAGDINKSQQSDRIYINQFSRENAVARRKIEHGNPEIRGSNHDIDFKNSTVENAEVRRKIFYGVPDDVTSKSQSTSVKPFKEAAEPPVKIETSGLAPLQTAKPKDPSNDRIYINEFTPKSEHDKSNRLNLYLNEFKNNKLKEDNPNRLLHLYLNEFANNKNNLKQTHSNTMVKPSVKKTNKSEKPERIYINNFTDHKLSNVLNQGEVATDYKDTNNRSDKDQQHYKPTGTFSPEASVTELHLSTNANNKNRQLFVPSAHT
ncbi:putative uncharacterized protein DDB_G0282133 [Clytia hemisphaerica]|uniref:putative uncharacterized protein DDB_G0282133 n=1 Tax=Clytia hemisphaerica TaxID=252671 RepID=UPI0034D69D46